MKLYEFEGHRILAKAGIESPFFIVCENLEEVEQARMRLSFPIVAKVQVLSGKRGKGGGIKVVSSEKALVDFCRGMLGKNFSGEEVRFISLTRKINIKSESYISITYDTSTKTPFLMYSAEGGMDIEELQKNNPEAILRVEIDPLNGPKEKDLKKLGNEKLADFALRLWDAFVASDARLIEVNPLAIDAEGNLVAVDAKVILDDSGLARHRDLEVLPKGAASAIPTQREIEAKKIDEEDYRGSAGSTFIEFDGPPRIAGEAGDIAVLASGGGASLLVMDALIANGGKPANYTEYSGNPPAEKVERLTKITLEREGISGCLVAGAVANFTDIYETLRGFAEGLKQVKPRVDFPIVVRRGGPRQKEAYEMLTKLGKKEGYDFHLFGPETPISVAAKKMVELSVAYKNKKFSS
ncbi:hypothetical protein HY382_00785 [Candidatus Curtissbacteria bacterium]|nr:hypothetical protein [Candidatus Curtissbacteria bacterium]